MENELFEIILTEDYLDSWLQITSVDLTNDEIINYEVTFVKEYLYSRKR